MKKFQRNGEPSKVLLEMTINEIRENRTEINAVKDHLITGAGKIAANRQAVTDIQSHQKTDRMKVWGGAGAITIVINIIKELIQFWR